jgi:hypothetical protein
MCISINSASKGKWAEKVESEDVRNLFRKESGAKRPLADWEYCPPCGSLILFSEKARTSAKFLQSLDEATEFIKTKCYSQS